MELKQRRFWTTHVNRKWAFFSFNKPWRYHICIAKCRHSHGDDLSKILFKTTAQECKQSLLPFNMRRSNTSLLIKLAIGMIGQPWHSPFNSLSPDIHIQILQTDLHVFPQRISWENLIKDQSIFPKVIILLILVNFSFDNVLILREENSCWSLLELEG